jgi:dipeptidyl-peptidase-4
MILVRNSNQIFRHSLQQITICMYKTKLTKLFDFQIQEPTFLLMEKNCLCKRNNLFVYDLASKKTMQITTDGKKNEL